MEADKDKLKKELEAALERGAGRRGNGILAQSILGLDCFYLPEITDYLCCLINGALPGEIGVPNQ
jgi:hypothetical protein